MSAPLATFPEWQRASESLPASERCELFASLPADYQRDCWAVLRQRTDGQRLIAEEMVHAERPPRTRRLSALPPRGGRPHPPTLDDPLLRIAPPEYFRALAGVDVPPDGGMVCCPLHDDHNPSCMVYADPGRGWICYAGCGAGSVYDLAKALSGLGDRGEDFKCLQRWIAERLLSAPLEAA